MDKQEVTAKLTAHQQEDAVLQYFKNNWTTNPKKLCKMAQRIWNDQPMFIQKGLLENVLNDVNPAKLLQTFFTMMAEWKEIIPKLIADGNHGMIVKGNSIHGFDLKAQNSWLKEHDKWHPDQEAEIQNQVLNTWMDQQGLIHFHGKIVLFDAFGFSGIAREVYI